MNQEVNQMTLDFRDNYESKSQGKIWIRMQYIQDEIISLKEVISAFQSRRELISSWIELFESQRQIYRDEHKQSFDDEYFDVNNKDSYNAGFYSELEWDESSLKKINLKDRNFMETLRSYDMTEHEISFTEKAESNNSA